MASKVQAIHDTAMRGGFCALWMAALILTIEEWMFAVISDIGSPERAAYCEYTLGYFAVLVVAALAHGYLLHERAKSERTE
jgi:hypothetical protein